MTAMHPIKAAASTAPRAHKPPPTIERTAFRTSRLLDFVSEKELVMQCGHRREDWRLVAVKELIDNALDACEEQGIQPKITLTVDDSGITVTDNGKGIPPHVADQLLDFAVRVSSREAYVAPDRGAQGNALKTIIAMPFVLDGQEGRVDIAGGGVESRIAFSVDRIAQRPGADVERSKKTGSWVRIHWPLGASYGRPDDARFLQDDAIRPLADDYTFLNPHLTLTTDIFDQARTVSATDPEWRKWTPSSPTCPHWYEPEQLERLIGAYVTHDAQGGRSGRTVREFIGEFKGLSSTIKQKAVLAELGLARAPLAALVAGRDLDHDLVVRLLAAMKAQTRPVKPAALGVIGRDHLETRFEQLGIRAGSFDYKKVASLGEDGLPQVTEVAFAALDREAEPLESSLAERWTTRRRLVTGVNWSAAWVNPFRTLGDYGRSLDAYMVAKRMEMHRPIALLVHVAHPRVQYSDRGKSTVVAS